MDFITCADNHVTRVNGYRAVPAEPVIHQHCGSVIAVGMVTGLDHGFSRTPGHKTATTGRGERLVFILAAGIQDQIARALKRGVGILAELDASRTEGLGQAYLVTAGKGTDKEAIGICDLYPGMPGIDFKVGVRNRDIVAHTGNRLRIIARAGLGASYPQHQAAGSSKGRGVRGLVIGIRSIPGFAAHQDITAAGEGDAISDASPCFGLGHGIGEGAAHGVATGYGHTVGARIEFRHYLRRHIDQSAAGTDGAKQGGIGVGVVVGVGHHALDTGTNATGQGKCRALDHTRTVGADSHVVIAVDQPAGLTQPGVYFAGLLHIAKTDANRGATEIHIHRTVRGRIGAARIDITNAQLRGIGRGDDQVAGIRTAGGGNTCNHSVCRADIDVVDHHTDAAQPDHHRFRFAGSICVGDILDRGADHHVVGRQVAVDRGNAHVIHAGNANHTGNTRCRNLCGAEQLIVVQQGAAVHIQAIDVDHAAGNSRRGDTFTGQLQ